MSRVRFSKNRCIIINQSINQSINQLINQSINQLINQSIRALMQVDEPQRDRVNEYITVAYHVKNNDNLDLNMHTDGKIN